MEGAIVGCPVWWKPWLPDGIRRIRRVEKLSGRHWDILVLMPSVCGDPSALRPNSPHLLSTLNAILPYTSSAMRCILSHIPAAVPHPHTLPEGLQCAVLLLPGDCPAGIAAGIHTDHAVSYGLSLRDSLTLSSLRQPVLCVQRELPRPDGGTVEPQEIPLRYLPAPADWLLPLLGLRLLCL